MKKLLLTVLLIAPSAFSQTVTNFDYSSTRLVTQAFKCPTEVIASLEDGKNEIISASEEISADHLVGTVKLVSGYWLNGKEYKKYETTIVSTVHPTNILGGSYPVTTVCSQNKL